jgi:hypothetical protein
MIIASVIPSSADPRALFFDGANDYVTFGAATNINNLGVSNFTVECWFKREGAGKVSNTGNGGIYAVPLVTKGMAEAEKSNVDCNWFFGLGTNNSGQAALAADFEDMDTGLNHPIRGNAVVGTNVWVHGAVTYNVASSNWTLYVNGALDVSTYITGVTNPAMLFPRYDSKQHGALATSLLSTGATNSSSGFFRGVLDEVRVWNYARSGQEIADNYRLPITSATGLIARWGLDQTGGSWASNSISGGVSGMLTNGPVWTNGYVSDLTVSLNSPTNGSTVAGDWMAIEAAASPSTTATATNVAFYEGATKLGEDTAAPYTLNWCAVIPGTYALTAVAMDTSGASATSAVVNVTVSAPAATGALAFDGNNDYVTFGQAPELGLTTFTIECWFKRTGAGKTTTTGTGGVTDALPLVTKGRGEAENSNVDMNWFLGISTNSNVLAADFEEGAVGSTPGLNHPVLGSTPLANGVWYHAAATYDGDSWALYLNGNLEATLAVSQPPRWDSIQHAALASALRSTGAAEGFFQGLLDEVRIWNYARSASQIADNYHSQVTNQAGLIARWALNEGTGSLVRNAVCGGVNGTLLNGPAWATDSFDANIAPSVNITNPANNTLISSASITIEAEASDVDGSVSKVEFYEGSTLLGEDNSSPYGLTWSGVAPGNYALRTVATDNLGLAATSSVVNVTVTPPPGVGGLYFEGANDYVTVGAAPELGVSNFTVECWFKIQGAGKRANTGSGGVYAVPLVTKGMAENEAGATNMNYFFGIGTNSSGQAVLAADFEDMNNGLNHPVRGTALVASNTWQHGAVTYDVAGSNWVLYLNGVPDTTNIITGPAGITNLLMLLPHHDSIQHAALGSCLLSSGATNADSGFFAGTLDEVRIWNYVRSAQEITNAHKAQIANAPGLIARWALDDASGLAATNSGTSGVAGTLANGPVWVEGYAFTPAPVITNEPASQTVQCGENVSFTVGASGTSLSFQWYRGASLLDGRTEDTLSLTNVSDADAGTYTVTVHNPGGTATSAPAVLTVADTNPPVITACATNQTLVADGSCQAAVPDLTPQVVASDSCTAVSVSQSPAVGTLVGLGTHVVTLTASDAATNQTTCTVMITVVDVTAPVITSCATNQTVNADSSCQAAIPDLTGQVIATDNCGTPSISQSPAAGTLVGLGAHLVTLTASDAATNQATCTAAITVVDGNVPTITTQPQGRTNLVGSTASFSVAADSCSAVGYQWMFGTNALPGETRAVLTLTNVQTAQAGGYSVVLTNATGGVTSEVAILTVQLPMAPTLASGPGILPNGHFSAGFTGTPEVPYTIEAATNLTGAWQPLTNITADPTGLIKVEDFTEPAPPERFYRAVYP